MPNQFTTGKTKQEMVAEVLRSLNFLQEDAPPDWKNRVEQALNRQGVQVHYTTIYETRKKEMQKLRKQQSQQPRPSSPVISAAEKKDETPVNRTVASNHQVPATAAPVSADTNKPVGGTPNVAEKLTLADAKAIKDFAKKFGGLDGLSEAVEAVSELFNDE